MTSESDIRAVCGHPVSWNYHLRNPGKMCQECRNKMHRKHKSELKIQLDRSKDNGEV
jgi:hypothetical protein